jgi:hypothetical protein
MKISFKLRLQSIGISLWLAYILIIRDLLKPNVFWADIVFFLILITLFYFINRDYIEEGKSRIIWFIAFIIVLAWLVWNFIIIKH